MSLAGCMVMDAPYPLEWETLENPPSADCRYIEGRYADRGQSIEPVESRVATTEGLVTEQYSQVSEERSFTRELLGEDSPWESALEIRLHMPADDAVEVTVLGKSGKALTRTFTAQSGDFQCDAGRMILHGRRWVASDLMSGREKMRMELQRSSAHLVAHVFERDTGLVFAVVPLSGDSARWIRFPRLAP
ncbi:MAG TPA: hypothetical protein VFX09_00955 [Burkholderiales bacterium]|nr:hypothetical protein [Burkholderiales bacterium]